MRRVVERFPTLKVVFEHITTGDAVQFVTEASANVGATITAHHLLYNRNHMLVGGIRPHFYCLPILKRNTHQEALLDAATSGSGSSSSAPTRRPTPSTPRKPPAAAPVATPPTPPSSCMPKRSNSVMRWTSSKPSPASTARVSTACRQHRSHHPGSRRMDRPDQPAIWRADRYPLRAGEKLRWRLLEEHA
jgi:dihydroorotase